MVAVEPRKQRIALGVDNVLGVQQVVVKEIDGLASTCDFVAGGALMGDGSVALVIDLDKVHAAEIGVEGEAATALA